jgi:SAM-dependent methyltransferase
MNAQEVRFRQEARAGEARAATLEERNTRLAEQLAAQEAKLQELTRASEVGITKLDGSLQTQGANLDQLARGLSHLSAQFAARPYMSQDSFGCGGDLSKPMGYALDAANLATEPDRHLDFMELFRGREDFIAERQRVYLPFVQGMKRVIDLGCGRGEFLRLLAEKGIRATGVEMDEALVERLRREGHEVIAGDAVNYLRSLPEATVDAIFSAQVIEHLDPKDLRELLALSRTRLRRGGVLIAETVNPESHQALKTFHVDLTHQRPIYPQVLLHLCREAGFPSGRVFYPTGGGFTQVNYQTAGEYAVIAVA